MEFNKVTLEQARQMVLEEQRQKYHDYYLNNKDKWKKYNEARKQNRQIKKMIKEKIGGINNGN